MGADTDGKIKSNYGIKDIQRALKHKFNIESSVENTHSDDYYILNFSYKEEHRNLSVFENYVDDETKEIVTHMNMGMWGSSVKLMRGILEGFGGYIKENDCDDDWEYVSPSDKVHLTEEELLEDKLFQKLESEDMDFVSKQRIISYVKDNLEFIKTL